MLCAGTREAHNVFPLVLSPSALLTRSYIVFSYLYNMFCRRILYMFTTTKITRNIHNMYVYNIYITYILYDYIINGDVYFTDGNYTVVDELNIHYNAYIMCTE